MSSTIAAYNVAFGLNAKGMIDGSKLARNEVRALASTFKSLETPADKFEQKLTQLENAYKKGAITWDVYRANVDKLKTSYRAIEGAARKVEEAERQKAAAMKLSEAAMRRQKLFDDHVKNHLMLNSALDKQHTLFTRTATSAAKYFAVFATGYVGLQTFRRVADSVTNSIERIDKLSKTSKALGVSVNDLQRFTYAMDEMAGIDVGNAEGMLSEMSKRVGLASVGKGRAQDFLKILGLDAATISKQSPVRQFEEITDAIRKQGDQSQKLAMATGLFGDEGQKLLPILNATNDEWKESVAWVDKLGLSMTDLAAEKMEAVNDSLARAHKTIEGLSQTLTIEFADAIQKSADSFVGFGDNIRAALKDLSDFSLKLEWTLSIMTGEWSNASRVRGELNKPWDFGLDPKSIADRMEIAAERGRDFDAQQNQLKALEKPENPFKVVTSNARKGGLADLFPDQANLLKAFSAATTAAFASADTKKRDMSQTNTLFDVNSAEYQKFLVKGQQDVEEKQLKELQEQKMIWKGAMKVFDVMAERLETISETRIGRLR